MLDKARICCYNHIRACEFKQLYGGVAQLARAFGSYPKCHWFKSYHRYHSRPGGQAVKTPPFHGGNTSSILVRVTINDKYQKGACRFFVLPKLLTEVNLYRIMKLLIYKWEFVDMTEFLEKCDIEYFKFEDHDAVIAVPKVKPNGRLAIKTEYWGAFKATETALLEEGFHVCFIANDNRWGIDSDLDRKARFIKHINQKYNTKKCVPVGMSCGGLIAIKLAAKYPELIDCLYIDAPVLNYMSCPCGFGVGEALSQDHKEILDALSLQTISELLAYREMPLDKLPQLIENKIPVVMVAGDSDNLVPYIENGILLEKAYKNTDIPLKVYIKPGCDHHPHGLDDPSPVVEFIKAHK